MNIENIGSEAAVTGGGFIGGLLLGYALKKVVKLIAVIVGLFIAGLAYLQYQQLASFNWDKIEATISTIANATTNTFNDYILKHSQQQTQVFLLLVVCQLDLRLAF